MSHQLISCDSLPTQKSSPPEIIAKIDKVPQETFDHAHYYCPGFTFIDSTSLPGTPIEGLRMLQASFEQNEDDTIVHFQGDLPQAQARLPDWLYRWIHPAHLSRAGYITQLLQYQLIDGLAQIGHLQRGQSWLHASVVEKKGYRVAIVAGGGMGKTGSLLQLVGPGAWSYLSDDWTTLERSGFVHRSRKPIQLYPRNLSRDMENDLLRSLSFSSRLAWRMRQGLGRKRGLRRKLDANRLFGSQAIGTPGSLNAVLYLERGHVSEIIERDVDATNLASGAGAIVADELIPSMKLLVPHLQTISRGTLTSTDAVASQTVRVLQDAFADCQRVEVTVPHGMPEQQIENYLVDRVNRLS